MNENWPRIFYPELKATLETVHMWVQIAGKIKLRSSPWTNHSWHATLFVSPRGLTTGSIPFPQGIFELEFDFIDHALIIAASTGNKAKIDLYPRTVASFYKELFEQLNQMGIHVKIHGSPNEVMVAVPFAEDEIHKTYDRDQITRLWKAMVSISKVLSKFRAGFVGKSSPVQFFWGSFDLAVSRFSGRRAPVHPGGAPNVPACIMQEAYSHEVSSCGFWPGSEPHPEPAFYSYIYPKPANYETQEVKPKEAFFSQDLGEFLLPYEVVRKAPNPEDTLMDFIMSAYVAAACAANWEREKLEAVV